MASARQQNATYFSVFIVSNSAQFNLDATCHKLLKELSQPADTQARLSPLAEAFVRYNDPTTLLKELLTRLMPKPSLEIDFLGYLLFLLDYGVEVKALTLKLILECVHRGNKVEEPLAAGIRELSNLTVEMLHEAIEPIEEVRAEVQSVRFLSATILALSGQGERNSLCTALQKFVRQYYYEDAPCLTAITCLYTLNEPLDNFKEVRLLDRTSLPEFLRTVYVCFSQDAEKVRQSDYIFEAIASHFERFYFTFELSSLANLLGNAFITSFLRYYGSRGEELTTRKFNCVLDWFLRACEQGCLSRRISFPEEFIGILCSQQYIQASFGKIAEVINFMVWKVRDVDDILKAIIQAVTANNALPARTVVELLARLFKSLYSPIFSDAMLAYIRTSIQRKRGKDLTEFFLVLKSYIFMLPELKSLTFLALREQASSLEDCREVLDEEWWAEERTQAWTGLQDNKLQQLIDTVLDSLHNRCYDSTLDQFPKRTFTGVGKLETPSHSLVQSQLYHLLQTKGLPVMRALLSDSILWVTYEEFFTRLQHSPLYKVLNPTSKHICLTQFSVSNLLRLFSFDLPVGANSEVFFRERESQLLALQLGGLTSPSEEEMNLVDIVLKSPAVIHCFHELSLPSPDPVSIKRQMYFADIYHAHGISVYGGAVLVRKIYACNEDPWARFGFILTVLYEAAHFTRKYKGGAYDVESTTPVGLFREGSADVYIKGQPGDTYRNENSEEHEHHGEGGCQLEMALFGKQVTRINSSQLEYLICMESWKADYEEFRGSLEALVGRETHSLHSYAREKDEYHYGADDHSHMF